MSQPTPSTPVLADPAEAENASGWRAASWSETGIYHPTNEDKACIQGEAVNPIFCGVSDGVGGGSMGHIASAALMDYCSHLPSEVLPDPARLASWFNGADAVVASQIARHSPKPGAATMVGVWFLASDQIRVIHVGDCRLYRWQAGQLQQLTQDQTYQRYQQSPPAGGSPDDPARMVGVNAIGTPEINDFTLQTQDMLLLCSDGLHKFVSTEQLQQLLQNGIQQQLSEQQICQQLVSAAKQAGSHDDVTALLLRHYPSKTTNKLGLILLALVLLIGLAWYLL